MRKIIACIMLGLDFDLFIVWYVCFLLPYIMEQIPITKLVIVLLKASIATTEHNL